MNDRAWMEQAACLDVPVGWFFDPDLDARQAAKRVCAGCTVRESCLAFAVDQRIGDGVWGGLTELERRRMGVRRARRG